MDKYTRLWHKFQASGRDVADIGGEIGDPDLEGVGGRIYGHGWDIVDTTRWPNCPHAGRGRWHTIIGRTEYQSDELEALESALFQFAVGEGWDG